MKESKIMADCAMTAALSVVIMILGGVLGLGMYASPMIAGMLLMPLGRRCGVRAQWTLWAAVSLLSLILVPDVEETLMYIAIFGLYPQLYPLFEKLLPVIRRIAKLVYFNAAVVAVEALVMLVLVPETLGFALGAVLLVMGNVVFLCYDFLLPRAELLLQKYLSKLKKG